MRNVIKGMLTAAALVGLVGITSGIPSYASTATMQDRDATKAPAPFTGEVMRVNPDAKTIVVKSSGAEGKEMQFSYSDGTVVTGAQNNVAGLASSNGSEVTISYRVEGGMNMATKIEVRAKK